MKTRWITTTLVLIGLLGLSATTFAAPAAKVKPLPTGQFSTFVAKLPVITPPSQLPSPPPPPPIDEDTQAALKELRAQLRSLVDDLNEMIDTTDVSEELIQTLYNDLVAVLDNAVRPDEVLVEALFTDLANAMEDGDLSNVEKLLLMQSIVVVLDSANLEQDEVMNLLIDVKALMVAMDISPEEAELIIEDLQLVADDIQALMDAVQ